MELPGFTTDCTQKLIMADWPIRSLTFNLNLHTLGRWAALNLKSLQGALPSTARDRQAGLPFAFSDALRADKRALGLVQLQIFKE